MAYEFTKLSDVTVAETPADNAHVLIEEDGVIKKAPKTAVGGGGEPTTVIKISTDFWYKMNADSVSFETGDYSTLCTDGVADPTSVRVIHELSAAAVEMETDASANLITGTSIPVDVSLSLNDSVLSVSFVNYSFTDNYMYHITLIFNHSTGAYYTGLFNRGSVTEVGVPG